MILLGSMADHLQLVVSKVVKRSVYGSYQLEWQTERVQCDWRKNRLYCATMVVSLELTSNEWKLDRYAT